MVDYNGMDAAELYDRRMEMILEFGRLEEELNRRRVQGRHIVRSEDQVWRTKAVMEGMQMKQPVRSTSLVAPEQGFDSHNFHAFILEIPRGSQEGAYHTHGEAVKYYLEGEGLEIIGENRYQVKAGDTVFIPAFTWHGTQNTGAGPIRIFAVSHGEVGAPLVKQVIYASKSNNRPPNLPTR